jgi:multidrug efflux system outer membrane protein
MRLSPRHRFNTALILLAATLLTGCTLGPNYRRPEVPVPTAFRTTEPVPADSAIAIGDLQWFAIFKDDRLQQLIRTALAQNYDLKDAYARVEQARAGLGITRSNQFPNFASGSALEFNRFSRDGATRLSPAVLASQNRNFGSSALDLLSFEVDIWGKLRRATEAARAQLLSAEENRKTVVTTLVSDVATAYLTLRELDYELEISNRTLETRRQSLELTRTRQGGGVATLLDLRQAEQLVDSAAATIPTIEQKIEQTENQIKVLLGEDPGTVERGLSLVDQSLPPDVPAGLPSELLKRRPDIRAAEQNLIALNAEIGVARAAYFPQLSLSGFLGGQSTQLLNLFSGSQTAWNLTPQGTQPIFTAGRIKSTVKLAEARRDSALAQYQKTIRIAFAEVSDSLTAHGKVRESREKQEALVETLQDRVRLAYVRYRGGVDTQLNALDADRDLFQAELALAQTRLEESLTVVHFYKALGGGWQ